jgi:glucan 1,3-beta-glucosidase
VEWNVRQPTGDNAGAGMWDSHIRCARSGPGYSSADGFIQVGGRYDLCFPLETVSHLHLLISSRN